MRTALALADDAPIGMLHLTQDFLGEMKALARGTSQASIKRPESVALDDIAADAIRGAMQSHAGNVSAVARQLGISRNTLYRKLKLLGLA